MVLGDWAQVNSHPVNKMAFSIGEASGEDLLAFLAMEELLVFDPTDDLEFQEQPHVETVEEDTEVSSKERFLSTNVSKASPCCLLERLCSSELNIENERVVAEALLKLQNSSVMNDLVDSIATIFVECFQLKASKKNKRLRSVELERRFSVERAKPNDAWNRLVAAAGITESTANDVVYQHIVQHFWSTIGSVHAVARSPVQSPFSVVQPDEMESCAIKDHAGWAIKRARDMIKSMFEDQLKIQMSLTEQTAVPIERAKALALISQLGEDQKQVDGRYRFIPNEAVCTFFVNLHDSVDILLSKQNILVHGGEVVVNCLKHLSVDKELRRKWSGAVNKFSFSRPVEVFVLQYICTMFVKSKQQIIREKFGLKPQKGSVALREGLNAKSTKSSKPSSSTGSSAPPKQLPSVISTLRQNVENPELVSKLLKEISQSDETDAKEILQHLAGKELTKILAALGKPALDGKAKKRQIDVLLTARPHFTVKYPEKVTQTLNFKDTQGGGYNHHLKNLLQIN